MDVVSVWTELFAPQLPLTLAGATVFAVIGYALSRLLRRNDVADFLWGLGFMGVSWAHALTVPSWSLRATVALVFVTLWGVRLSAHLVMRLRSSPNEDPRYAQFRRNWGAREPVYAFLQVFVLQALLMAVIVTPVTTLLHAPERDLRSWDFVGLTFLMLGLCIETMADAELAAFRRERRGVLREGLWSYMRHPNYFGEILFWWGFFFLCLGVPLGYLTVLSPVLISYLLIKVSGVPMLEKALARKGAEFAEYVKVTPALIPLPAGRVVRFAMLALVMMVLDIFWLGIVMKDYYHHHLNPIVRQSEGQWQVWLGPALLTYVFMAAGVQFFALRESVRESLFRGAIYGLCLYGVYDLTNLATLAQWPAPIAFVDFLWGPVVCGLSAGLVSGATKLASRRRAGF